MREFLTKTFSSKPITVCGVLFILVAPTRLANADPLQEARVSQVIQDVRLLEAHAAPHPAALNDKVTVGSAVRTGVESRAELTFKDLTITRLGANTIFSFTAGARQAELTKGAILLQVPPGAPAVRANTTSVTVSVMGGTALLAAGPPTKFMVLEGTGTIYPLGHPEKAVTVHGGEMVIAEHGHVGKPEKFDVKLVLATSALIVDFPPLANLPLILAVVDQQQAEQLVMVSNPPPYKSMLDVIDVTDQNATANPAVVAVRTTTPTPTPPPPPPPSKFGTPSTIASPNPYLITNGTTITTDPSITTNGVTDFGKIYRGSADDGAFSLWAFGSTSAFDNAINLDTDFFADPNHLPIAAFKFQNLSLNGNPTIDISNGGVTKLALIGVNGITSGAPGGTLTFTGLDLLALATVDGSIHLTSDVSFQDISVLGMYARGAGSNLILNSPISHIGTLELAAEGSIQLTNPGTMRVGAFEATAGDNLTLQIGGSLLLDGKVRLDTLVLPGTTVANGANLRLNITGDYTNTSATDFSLLHVRNGGAHIGTGGNINVSIGGDLTTTQTGGDFDLLVQNTNGRIDNGGDVTLNVNGGVSTQGQLSLLVENYDGSANPSGHIGTGGNISVTTGGDLAADSVVAFVNNRNGGFIGSGGNITLNIGGALVTQHNAITDQGEESLFLLTSNRNDGSGGGTIGSDVAVRLSAASVSVGGNMLAGISTNYGGTIAGSATLSVALSGNLTTSGDADIDIQNFGSPSSAGGTIGSDAVINLVANNISTGGYLDVYIGNDSGVGSMPGGTIHGNALVDLRASSISTTGILEAAIFNYLGHHIDGNATVNVDANSISAGSDLDVSIDNGNGGVIGSNATLTLNLAGNLTTQGAADIEIRNNQNSASNGSAGGSIGSAATLTISAADISIGNLFTARILNHRAASAPGPNGGSIGTDATLSINAASLTVGGASEISIYNRDAGAGSGTGGSIGGNAAINLNIAGTLSSGGEGDFLILNESTVPGSPGGSIGGNATINISAGNIGDATNHGDEVFSIGNRAGTINMDASIGVAATNITANSLLAQIDNSNAGSIGGNATIDLNALGTVSTAAAFNLLLENYDESANPAGHIGGSANVSLTTGGNFTADFACIAINNRGGGRIDSSVNLNVNIGGTLTTLENGPDFLGNPASFSVALATRYDDQFGNTQRPMIGGDATVSLHADSASIGGILGDGMSNRGGTIGGNALVNFNVTHDATITGDATMDILNDGAGFPFGGTIHGNATLQVSAANLSARSLGVVITNGEGGVIDSNATLGFTGNLTTTQESAQFDIFNTDDGTGRGGGTITGDAVVNVNAGNITTAPDTLLLAEVKNLGGSIGGNATVTLAASGNVNAQGNALLQIVNENDGVSGPGTINGDATLSVTSAGSFSTAGLLHCVIDNSSGGSIMGSAALSVNAANISTNSLVAQIQNRNGGTIGGSANINFSLTSDVTAQGDANFGILNEDEGSGGGTIGSDATSNVTAANISTGGSLIDTILNNGGGRIVGIADLSFNLTGDLATQGDAIFVIDNSNGGTIGTSAAINVTATNISVGTPLAPADLTVSIGNTSGSIGGSVATNLNVSGDITVAGPINARLDNGGATSSPGSHITGDATINVLGATGINAGNGAFFAISNEDAGSGTFGGTIDGNALVHVTADHLSTEALAPSDFNLFGTIHNRGGTIGGNCDVMFDIAGAITTAGRASFDILNFDDGGVNGGGIIGGDARVSINAGTLSIGGELLVDIQNQNAATINGNGNVSLSVGGNLTATDLNISISNYNTGTIGGDAAIDMTANNISTGGSLFADIFNFSGGSIGGGAMINLTAANITANSLTAQIDNTGGTIGANTEGGAIINMNVSNSATVTTDATVAIYGSDGAVGGAAININGGNYNVGGTFLSYIDGNGTITFSNATAHADVLKAGVFGANGVLNIGGGMLSADTTLKLYASGSNGTLNFLSNVTLGGSALTKILAANTINIFDNVVLTIGGSTPVDVYTNNANYTGFGGNGTRTGTFAGAGAHDPQPLANAPPFGTPTPAPGNHTNARPRIPTTALPSIPSIAKTTRPTVNVSNTDQLLAMLDNAAVGPDGRITMSSSNSTSNLRNLSRMNINALPREARRILMQQVRDRSIPRVGNRRIL